MEPFNSGSASTALMLSSTVLASGVIQLPSQKHQHSQHEYGLTTALEPLTRLYEPIRQQGTERTLNF